MTRPQHPRSPHQQKEHDMSDKLTGADLEQALKDRGLPVEGTADEKRAAVAQHDADKAKSDGSHEAATGDDAPDEKATADDAMDEKGTTTLDSHLDAPSVTAPGDGPADTTDPSEIASSATPDKGASAKDGNLTVNAVVKVGETAKVAPTRTSDPRIETYEATKPNGDVVTVTHNLDTGATSVEPVA
jgi:hypothetical protein